MKQIFSVFSSVILLMILAPNLTAQADFPGSEVVLKVFGLEALDAESAAETLLFCRVWLASKSSVKIESNLPTIAQYR